MTFSLIDELRKDLAATEERINYHSAYTEYYRNKHAQLLEAILILEVNELVKTVFDNTRDFTPEENQAHENVLRSLGEVEEEGVFSEKPKRRIYTIRNNEPLVKLIIPDHEYEAYRKLWSDDAVEVCVENDEMYYAADSELEYDWRLSLTKEQNPQEFFDVLALLEIQSQIELAERLKLQPSDLTFRNRVPRVPYPHPVQNWSNPPEWNYVGDASAIEVAVTKEER